jgi:hypothetical protein
MDRTAALVTDLRALLADLDLTSLADHGGDDHPIDGEASDRRGLDLALSVTDLQASLHLNVPSLVGLRLVLVSDGVPIVLTVTTPTSPETEAVTSMRLTFGWLTPFDDASMIILSAAAPGAFVDLAADLGYLLGRATVVLDADLEPVAGPAPTITGIEDFVAINRAVGVLIGHGWDVEDAQEELARQAAVAGVSLSAAAAHVLGR